MAIGTQLLLHFDGSIPAPALLLHFDGNFTDSSSYANSVSVSGASIASTGQKFGTGCASLASTNYFSVPTTAGGPLDLASGDFTYEGWINPTTVAEQLICENSGPSGGVGIFVYLLNTNITVEVNGGTYTATSAAGLTANAWQHFAVVKSGTSLVCYLNGVGGSAATVPASLGTHVSTNLFFGYSPAVGSAPFVGGMDEIRVTAAALYVSNFTPPTAPNTVGSPFLVAITDSSPNAFTMTHAGTLSALSTTDPKFGTANATWSAQQYAANGWSTPLTPGGPLDLSQTAFTVECWVNGTTQPNAFAVVFSDDSPTSGAGFIRGYMVYSTGTSATIAGQFNYAVTGGTSANPAITATLLDGNWHHVVFSASSTQAGVAVDGVWGTIQVYGFSTSPTASDLFYIGYDENSPFQGNTFIGSIDELRVSNSVVYPLGTNFTPPTAPFTVPTNAPNIVGLSVPAANSLITGSGLTVGTATQVTSPNVPGTVVSQSPAAGTPVSGGAAISYTYSQGLVVPNVFNLSVPVATSILTAAGFTVGTISQQPDVLIIPGNVDAQYPAAGTYAAGGSGVNLTLSAGRGGVLVPNILGDTATVANAAVANVGLVVNASSTAPSLLYPAGEIISQNPAGGTSVAYGSFVSYVVSSGPPAPLPQFDFEATVISQFANSPTILQLCANMNAYVDQSQNFANFYSFVWNVDTAEGFGLDIWGKIVNVSRLLQIPTAARYVGFQDGTGPGAGTDVEPFSENGSWYTPIAASESYLLDDGSYRTLILTKALANIVNTTIPAFNQLLRNLFPGRGNPYVTTSGVMAMNFHFDFALTPIELAILQQSGAAPVPPGVSFTITVP